MKVMRVAVAPADRQELLAFAHGAAGVLYALAESYRRSLDVMHVDYVTGNPEYSGRAFVKMDETVIIEIVHRDQVAGRPGIQLQQHRRIGEVHLRRHVHAGDRWGCSAGGALEVLGAGRREQI